jgi:lipid-A-disaccharide synthase-like uncharacterized protein
VTDVAWPFAAAGWAGQGVFTARVLHQWIASERAKRSVVPRAYWILSLVGTALVLVYASARGDPVFVVGSVAQGVLFARNLALSRPNRNGTRTTPPRWVLLAFAAGLVALVLTTVALGETPAAGPIHPAWLSLGFFGQSLWLGRFLVQWWVSEREGQSRLPPAFFKMSVAGSVTLCAYAISQRDLVNVAAYALNPLPYARNLVLLRREAKG